MRVDTIVALSTPPGSSGIAVIRISGPGAAGVLAALTARREAWAPRTLHRTRIYDREGDKLDDAVAAVYRGPDSYTGEDMAEIFCHGSMEVASSVIEAAVDAGAVMAGPGEFTRRAFLSGKLDLAQAEAVADLVSSETRLQARVALEHLGGGLSRRIENLEAGLRAQLILVEASIDFPEEDIETWNVGDLLAVSRSAREEISGLLLSEVAGGKLRAGMRATIAGPRNAGKSSLYNAMLGEERALVSPVPGTTRDILRERIHIGGFTYYLEDTAGLAETDCEVEMAGIRKGREAAGAADLVIFVVDGSEGWSKEALDELEAFSERNHVVAVSKSDLGLATPDPLSASPAGADRTVHVSSVTGEGLERLRDMIFECTASGDIGRVAGERVALNIRQGCLLRSAEEALERLEREAGEGAPAEILSLELREALDACGGVTGRTAPADVLAEIFSKFCIGK